MAAFGAVSTNALAGLENYYTTNDYGVVGLLQTPTARMPQKGEFRFGAASTQPYTYIHFQAQPFEWLEGLFRYAAFLEVPYCEDEDDDGCSQSLKDRSFDLKFRLMKEKQWVPQISLGLQDLGGTGLLSSEYLVASKQFGDVDSSFGIAWGRLGAGGGFSNPLGEIDDSFREPRSGSGIFTSSRFFRGDEVGLFGGVQWRPGHGPFSLIVEYDGNDYSNEPFRERFGVQVDSKSRINAGLTYRWKNTDIGLAWERGDQFAFRISLLSDLERDQGPPKALDPPPTPVGPVGTAGLQYSENLSEQKKQFIENLNEALTRQSFNLRAVDFSENNRSLKIWYSQNSFRNEAKAIGRVARAAASLAPESYESFTMIAVSGDREHYRATLPRDPVRQLTSGAETDESKLLRELRLGRPQHAASTAEYSPKSDYPAFSWSISPEIRQNIGSPDGFFFGQIWLANSAVVRFSDRLDVRGTIGVSLVDNLEGLERESDSVLPHVRSDIGRYLREGKNNLVRLESNYLFPINSEWYGRASGGIFEEMFAGVAGEILYRPFLRPWAFGVDLAYVRQRDYDQLFDFLPYTVLTGHATFYYEFTKAKIETKLSAGRYLAKDIGATFEIARRFKSGGRIGVYATKTNISAEEFGEGEFDKGFFVSFPFDLFSPRSSKRLSTFAFSPLTRDGGQKVRGGRGLYEATDENDALRIIEGWDGVRQ